MGQEIFCKLGKPTSCLLGIHALVPSSEVFFPLEYGPPWYTFCERSLLVEEKVLQDQAQRKENVWSHHMLDMRHVCITLKLYWIRYYTRKALENRAMREVPTTAAVRSHFQSLTSLYIVIPLQGRNTAWYPQLGQALKNIYLGYFRAIWNNSELVYTYQHVLIGMWEGKF